MTLAASPSNKDWIPPSEKTLFAAMDATWPGTEICLRAGWRLRRGAGGGKRVSAATLEVAGADIVVAETAMRAWDQAPLFMLRRQDGELDRDLAARGYDVVDPVVLYAAAAPALAAQLDPQIMAIEADFPVASMAALWAKGGIGPARLAVMARTAGPSIYLLVRANDRPAGVGFVALTGDIAMLHAVEVSAESRRQGVGQAVTAAAARWALGRGATTLALATTRENEAANALYSAMGLAQVGGYHYRLEPKARGT